MSPEAFEQPATIALPGDAGLTLEGLFTPGSDADCSGAVIAPPHPLYGGSMDHPVVVELAHACHQADVASLRFNWRGVGASGGRLTGEADAARADYAASLAFLEESVSGPLVACGYSFGAVTAISAAASHAKVRRLLLVAPPASMLDDEVLSSFRGKVLIAVGEDDELASASALQERAAALEKGTFVSFPETDHFFNRSLTQLARAAREFLA